MKIHYVVGGWTNNFKGKITSQWTMLCGKKFKNWDSKIMQDGYGGAENTTCKNCRKQLDKKN